MGRWAGGGGGWAGQAGRRAGSRLACAARSVEVTHRHSPCQWSVSAGACVLRARSMGTSSAPQQASGHVEMDRAAEECPAPSRLWQGDSFPSATTAWWGLPLFRSVMDLEKFKTTVPVPRCDPAAPSGQPTHRSPPTIATSSRKSAWSSPAGTPGSSCCSPIHLSCWTVTTRCSLRLHQQM